MIREFAVQPSAIDNWKDFRFIYDQVGVEHGRLISRFPGKWAGMVIEAPVFNGDESLQDVIGQVIQLDWCAIERAAYINHRSIHVQQGYAVFTACIRKDGQIFR